MVWLQQLSVPAHMNKISRLGYKLSGFCVLPNFSSTSILEQLAGERKGLERGGELVVVMGH